MPDLSLPHLYGDPVCPPEFLYHCTERENLDSILITGLQKMQRYVVHMADDVKDTPTAGLRNRDCFLTISAHQAFDMGVLFYESVNGCYLSPGDIPPCCVTQM